MPRIFNENMTSNEAQSLYFKSVVGKTKEERAKIKAEYFSVLPIIIKNETKAPINYFTEMTV